ncbi:hypothetical protein HII36_45710 [Nonomuraea sp. NN258]|uniref:hypothetical protein n=1 Tax=Nonomuraea antri TaxID=2730852 RepID=UPI0015684336|nr:hypothetical protein [Nonomuraea antri]NRQ39072.1 hypothetical protein [Nonomuraea antri]
MADNTTKTHHLKPGRGAWGVDNDGRSVAEIEDFLKSLDAKSITQAGEAYLDACSVVATAQYTIKQESFTLSQVWEGKASVEAQKALRTLHATLRELSNKMNQMGRSLELLATVVRQHQEFLEGSGLFELETWNQNFVTFDDSLPDKYAVYKGNGATGTDFGSQDELAGLHLQQFSDELKGIYDLLPDSVHSELPTISNPVAVDKDPDKVTYPGYDPNRQGGPNLPPYSGSDLSGADRGIGGSGSSTPPSSQSSSSSPFGPTGPTGPSNQTNPGGGTGGPGSTDGTGTSPGSRTPESSSPSPNSPTDPSAAQRPGLIDPTNPAITDPTTSTNDTGTKLQDYRPPTTVPTAQPSTPSYTPPTTPGYTSPGYVTPSVVPGTYAGGTSVGGAAGEHSALVNGTRAATASTGMGMPFMPMGAGAGGGQDEQDRESSTWLHEEDDVWGGGDADGTVGNRLG